MERGEGRLVRVFLGESDRSGGVPLYEAIVQRALEAGIAGATVLRGVEGYGAHSRIHTARILRLAEDLPVIVELVDAPEAVEAFLPVLDEIVDEGLVTVETVTVIRYRPRSGEAEEAGGEE